MTEPKAKHAGGRPTLYLPEYCEEVIRLGKEGKSFEQIAAELNLALRTLYLWRDTYPQFMHAMEDSKVYEQAWWESQAQLYMLEHKDASKLNPSLWSRSMSARFPKKYRESTKTEITGADGASLLEGIQVTFVLPKSQE